MIFLVNQLDDEKCDYDAILEQLTSIYGNKVVPVQYPIKTGPDFNALIDVLLMKKYSWGPEGGRTDDRRNPGRPEREGHGDAQGIGRGRCRERRNIDGEIFESETLTEDEMREGIRKDWQHGGCSRCSVFVRERIWVYGAWWNFWAMSCLVSEMPKKCIILEVWRWLPMWTARLRFISSRPA